MTNVSNKKNKIDIIVKKILFTLSILIIYRVCSFIPMPCVDLGKINSFFEVSKGGFFNVFNAFSGGAIGRVSIFSLGIMPYITASIIVQLITSTSPEFKKMKKEGGDAMQEKFNQYTKLLSIVVATVQGISLSTFLLSSNITTLDATTFTCLIVMTTITSTFILLWFANRISQNGIGNGISLIVFTGIVAEMPKDIVNIFTLAKNGTIQPLSMALIFILFVVSILCVILFEKSNRLVHIQYPRQVMQHINQTKQQVPHFIPMKINPAGVMPPIFSNALLILPTTIVSLFKNSDNQVISFIIKHFTHGTLFFIIANIALISFFCFFYNNVVFDANEVSDQLRKSNIFIPGTRPGQQTAELLKKIMNKLSIIGSIYLGFICSVPEFFAPKYGYSFFIGGTGLLIVVNVISDTIAAIQSHMLPSKYDNKKKVYH